MIVSGITEIREAARRKLHAALSVPALGYADGPTGDSTEVRLRIHGRVFPIGSLTGGGFEYAEQLEDSPRLVFLVDEHVPVRGIVYSVKAELAYRVDTVEPRHGVTMAARAARLSVREAARYSPPSSE